MTAFAPLLPASGIVGFRLLSATEDAQRAVFDRQPEIARDVAYFAEKIGEVASAEDLVADRRLLRVALGAFGMDDEIDKRAFLRKILEDGSEAKDALANRLVDPRYAKFARSFGFGDALGARTALPGFAGEITAAYRERQFEIAVGEQDDALRLALNFRREIKAYAASPDPDGAAWFSVMGDLPVRKVFEGAFGLPDSFGQLDIDRQRDDLRALNDKTFGTRSLAVFADDEAVETAISRFLARRAAENGPDASTPGFAALTLLQNASTGFGQTGLQNLVLSSARGG